MKKNDILDLRAKTLDELKRMTQDTRGELDTLKKDQTLSKIKNSNAFRSKQKDLARILTFLGMKERSVEAKS